MEGIRDIIAATDSPDWVARGVGFGGLLVATCAAVLALLNYRRDRPRLRIIATDSDESCRWAILVTVVNTGYRPTSIARVELSNASASMASLQGWCMKRAGMVPRRLLGLTSFMVGSSSIHTTGIQSGPIMLQPGESYEYAFEPPQLSRFSDAAKAGKSGRHMYVSCVDVVGRSRTRKLNAKYLRDAEKLGDENDIVNRAFFPRE